MRGAAPEAARVICVTLHGRGQSPEEMEGAILARLPMAEGVAHALPRAEGASWYAARAVDPLTDGTRAELAASLAGVGAVVADLRARAPGCPVVLAGFSQGACLSLELALSGAAAPAAVVALTGCRVGRAGEARPRAPLGGLPVYLSGGQDDPWIPLSAMAEALADLGAAGAALRADVFPARGHEVSGAEIAILAGVLADLAAGRPLSLGGAR
jgi:phospholipase/carboxylesterase